MIIDWHTHVHSLREQANPFWKGQSPATIDNRYIGNSQGTRP